MTKPQSDDDRSAAQRCADALVELARRELDRGDLPDNHGVRPHLFALMQVEDAHTESDTESGRGLRLSNGRVLGGGCLSRKTLERLACDATISRVLLNPQGEILDLGRSTRVVTPAQWKALLVRDGGCVLPGHDCPPAFTAAHHLLTWLTDNGPTDLDNLALVCTFGHHLLHEDGFDLYLRSDQRWVLRRPDGTEIVGLPRGETGPATSSLVAALSDNRPRGPCPD
jgi:hypothetical protein